jgi:flavodoxin
MKKKVLIVLSSYHHKNTEKLADAISEVLFAKIISPNNIDIAKIQEYDLIGFGSGIYDGHHHQLQIELVDKLPKTKNKKVFLFSTTGSPKFIINDKFIKQNHSLIRQKLESKGYEVVGEFGCAGWNTNSFLKYFGGLNKDRPNNSDIIDVKEFALSLKKFI